jgi:hypothetical protein
VLGLATVVYQPNPDCADFKDLPFFYLAKPQLDLQDGAGYLDRYQPGQEPVRIWG